MNMIKTRFNELLGRRIQKTGHRLNLHQISQESGVGYATIHRWAKGDINRFDGDVLEKLCIYFECQVGDLIEYVPDPIGER